MATMVIWLVVEFQPLWKIMELKSVGMITFPTEWKNKKCSKQPSREYRSNPSCLKFKLEATKMIISLIVFGPRIRSQQEDDIRQKMLPVSGVRPNEFQSSFCGIMMDCDCECSWPKNPSMHHIYWHRYTTSSSIRNPNIVHWPLWFICPGNALKNTAFQSANHLIELHMMDLSHVGDCPNWEPRHIEFPLISCLKDTMTLSLADPCALLWTFRATVRFNPAQPAGDDNFFVPQS